MRGVISFGEDADLSPLPCTVPCRESALTLLDRLIEEAEDSLRCLRSLHTTVMHAEPGSALEEQLWRLLVNYGRR